MASATAAGGGVAATFAGGAAAVAGAATVGGATGGEGVVTESHNTGGRFNWKVITMVDEWDHIDDVSGRRIGVEGPVRDQAASCP